MESYSITTTDNGWVSGDAEVNYQSKDSEVVAELRKLNEKIERLLEILSNPQKQKRALEA